MNALRVVSVLAALAFLSLALTLPLPTYALSLGAFGLIHVLAELRYVDLRFAGRVPRSLFGIWALLLGVVILVRILAVSDILTGPMRAWAELSIVILLVLTSLWLAGRKGPRAGLLSGLAVMTVALLLYGSAEAPFETLVILAFLHNLTPVAFLAERLESSGRKKAMILSGILFGLIPVLILTGIPREVLAAIGWDGATLAIPGVGDTRAHLRVFVPSWLSGEAALNMFTAAVYLQCMHYWVVIGVLPRLLPADAKGVLPWPGPSRFALLLGGVGAISLLAFATSFAGTRELYGVFAAVHAWIEFPVLLASLTLVRSASREMTS